MYKSYPPFDYAEFQACNEDYASMDTLVISFGQRE